MTVLSWSSCKWAWAASGNSLNLVSRQSMAPWNAPASTSKSLRVSSVTTGRPLSSCPWSNQRFSVAAVTAGARPCCGWMVGWFMRMISFFTFTNSFLNGCEADQLSLGARVAKRGSCCSHCTQARTSAGGPAKNKLMPSSAIRIVPLSCWLWACAKHACCKAWVSWMGVNT